MPSVSFAPGKIENEVATVEGKGNDATATVLARKAGRGRPKPLHSRAT
jgi:hypothetical protein